MNGIHDVRVPAGPQAAALFDLWTVMLVTCTVVFVAIIVVLAVAVWRAPRATEQTVPDPAAHPRKETALDAARSAVRSPFLPSSCSCCSSRASSPTAPSRTLPLDDAVHIDLVGHQFWWEARYDADAILRGPSRPPTSSTCRSDVRC